MFQIIYMITVVMPLGAMGMKLAHSRRASVMLDALPHDVGKTVQCYECKSYKTIRPEKMDNGCIMYNVFVMRCGSRNREVQAEYICLECKEKKECSISFCSLMKQKGNERCPKHINCEICSKVYYDNLNFQVYRDGEYKPLCSECKNFYYCVCSSCQTAASGISRYLWKGDEHSGYIVLDWDQSCEKVKEAARKEAAGRLNKILLDKTGAIDPPYHVPPVPVYVLPPVPDYVPPPPISRTRCDRCSKVCRKRIKVKKKKRHDAYVCQHCETFLNTEMVCSRVHEDDDYTYEITATPLWDIKYAPYYYTEKNGGEKRCKEHMKEYYDKMVEMTGGEAGTGQAHTYCERCYDKVISTEIRIFQKAGGTCRWVKVCQKCYKFLTTEIKCERSHKKPRYVYPLFKWKFNKYYAKHALCKRHLKQLAKANQSEVLALEGKRQEVVQPKSPRSDLVHLEKKDSKTADPIQIPITNGWDPLR